MQLAKSGVQCGQKMPNANPLVVAFQLFKIMTWSEGAFMTTYIQYQVLCCNREFWGINYLCYHSCLWKVWKKHAFWTKIEWNAKSLLKYAKFSVLAFKMPTWQRCVTYIATYESKKLYDHFQCRCTAVCFTVPWHFPMYQSIHIETSHQWLAM